TMTIVAVMARCGLAIATSHRTTGRRRNPRGMAGELSAERSGIRSAIPPSRRITARGLRRDRAGPVDSPLIPSLSSLDRARDDPEVLGGSKDERLAQDRPFRAPAGSRASAAGA